MFEILMYLFESCFNAGDYPEPEKLTRKLSAAGFEGEEISEALSWLSLLQQQNAQTYPTTLNHGMNRCFAEKEREFLSDEAVYFLMDAVQREQITPVEREMVIDLTLALKQPAVSDSKIRLIVLMVLWNQHREVDMELVEELLLPLSLTQIH